MSVEFWIAILAAAALVVSLIAAYYAKDSAGAAERSANAAELAAVAARDQADETRRANDLTERVHQYERERDERANAVAWKISKNGGGHRLVNVGGVTAKKVVIRHAPTRPVDSQTGPRDVPSGDGINLPGPAMLTGRPDVLYVFHDDLAEPDVVSYPPS